LQLPKLKHSVYKDHNDKINADPTPPRRKSKPLEKKGRTLSSLIPRDRERRKN
jgi:hypothetical protein